MHKFDELIIQCNIQEDSRLILSRFDSTGLRSKLKRVVLTGSSDYVENAFQCTLYYETHLHTSLNRKFTFKAADYPRR